MVTGQLVGRKLVGRIFVTGICVAGICVAGKFVGGKLVAGKLVAGKWVDGIRDAAHSTTWRRFLVEWWPQKLLEALPRSTVLSNPLLIREIRVIRSNCNAAFRARARIAHRISLRSCHPEGALATEGSPVAERILRSPGLPQNDRAADGVFSKLFPREPLPFERRTCHVKSIGLHMRY